MSDLKEKKDKSDNGSPLNAQERKDVRDHHSLSSVSVYAVVHREGMEELNRPATSLWWSGVAAGLGISTSVMAEGILHKLFEGLTPSIRHRESWLYSRVRAGHSRTIAVIH